MQIDDDYGEKRQARAYGPPRSQNYEKKTRKTAGKHEKRAFTARFWHFGATILKIPQKSEKNRAEQSGADYDPQVGAMRWPPLATNVSLSPCGSSLTRDVRVMKMIFKKFGLTIMAILPFALLALWFGWSFGIFPDVGAESGYYGQLNRVKHVIESMPNVVIIDHWLHKDVTLEDFGFTIKVDGNRELNIQFWENTPQMKERSKDRLREFIQEEIDSNKGFQSTTHKLSLCDGLSSLRRYTVQPRVATEP